MRQAQRKGIQSIEVAFRILTALQSSLSPLSLKEIARQSGLTASATNNYLVSLVRTGLAATDTKAGFYRLGPATLAFGMSAMQQIDGFEIARNEVVALRNETQLSTAVTTWSDDGPVSLFKQDGELLGPFALRTGLISLLTTAAGKLFLGCLPPAATAHLLERELQSVNDKRSTPSDIQAQARHELNRKEFVAVLRVDGSGYVSIAAPVRDWSREVRFAISIIGTRATLQTDRESSHVKALLRSAARATANLGGSSSG